jgi:hypothetical protein
MKRSLLLAMVFVTMAVFSSCSDKDGDWDPMKWNISATTKKTVKNPTIDVAAAGGEYTLTCTNYSGFWLEDVIIDDETVWTSTDWTIQNNRTDVSTDYASIQASGKQLKINVKPNTGSDSHKIVILIECGDIFSTVTLNQPAAVH